MQLVIEVNLELYGKCKEKALCLEDLEKLGAAVDAGYVLPLDHGKLGDLDAVVEKANKVYFDRKQVVECIEKSSGAIPYALA